MPVLIYSSAGRLSNGHVTVGNQEEVRFYFAARELTVAEDEHFFDLDRESFPGLPADVGYTPPKVLFEYAPPGSAFITLEGDDVVEDAEGEYHAIITAPMDGNGVWTYRGRAVDGEGTPLASTPRRTFTVVGGEVAEVVPPTAIAVERGRAEAAEQSKLAKASNLSDVPAPATARANLGLGSAATHPATDFDAAGLAATEQARAAAAEGTLTTDLAAEAAARAAAVAEAITTAEAFAQTAVGEEATTRAAAVTAAIGTAEAASDAAGTAAAATAVEKARAEAAEATNAAGVTTAKGETATEKTRAETAEALKLAKASNLSDLVSAATARTNLGLGAAATRDVGFAAGNVMSGTATLDQIAPAAASVAFGTQLFSFGAGDLLGARVGAPPAAHVLDVRDGTAASPVKIGVSASYSRTDATTRAELNGMGPEGTDGPDGATVLRVTIKGTVASQVQISALVATAWQTGAYEGAGADACPVIAIARISGAATGRAIATYFETTRETATSGGQQASELRIKNSTEVNDAYVANAPSKSMGIWANAAGTGRVAAFAQIGHGFAQTFDVGLAANEGSITSAFLRDDSSGKVSLDIWGTHETAAIRIKNGSGAVMIGTQSLTETTTQLLEIRSEENRTPALRFAAKANVSHTLMFNNTAASFNIGQSGGAGNLLPETANGDGVIFFGAERTLHIGRAGTAAALRVGENVAIKTGPLLVGTTTRQAAGEALVEVYCGENALDPVVTFGTGSAVNVSSQLIRNSTGQLKVFAANGAGAFLTGTAKGDTGITYTAGKTFHIGAVGKASQFRMNETGIGFYTATPVAKQEVTGSRGGNAALASLLEKLATVGLVTNGSSA